MPCLLTLCALAQRADFRVDVETVTVHVSVTDKDGRPVRNLERTFFQVLENGQPQQIDSFFEMDFSTPTPKEAGRSPSPRPAVPPGQSADSLEKRFIVVRFDPLLSNRDLKRAKEAAQEITNELSPESDRISVSWLDFMSEFTEDRERLRLLIEELKPSLLSFVSDVDSPADPERGKTVAERIGESQRVNPANLAPRGLSGGPGADFSDLFPEVPQLNLIENAVAEAITLGTRGVLFHQIGALKYLRGKKILLFFGYGLPNLSNDARNPDLYDPILNARVFNDAGFTVFAINPAGLVPEPAGGFNPIGVRPRSASTGGLSPRERSESIFRPPSHPGFANLYLRRWAETTGGAAIYNKNDLGKAVHQVFSLNSHYYVLAYRPGSDRLDNKYRKIEVKLAQSEWAVRHREGYFATLPGPAELRRRSLYTALMMPEQFRDFPVTVEHSPVQESSINVFVAFPFRDVPLRKVELAGTGKNEKFLKFQQEILVFMAAFDSHNKLLAGREETFFLDFDEQHVASRRQQNATLERTLTWDSKAPPALLKTVVIVGQNEQVSVATTHLESH